MLKPIPDLGYVNGRTLNLTVMHKYVQRSWIYLFTYKEKYTTKIKCTKSHRENRIFKYNSFKSKTEFRYKLYILYPMYILP